MEHGENDPSGDEGRDSGDEETHSGSEADEHGRIASKTLSRHLTASNIQLNI